jgi:hypothetical protein
MTNDNGSRTAERSLSPKEAAKLREEGFQEGLNKGRMEIVDWLQAAYLDDEGRPDRGSPKAEAILEMARAAAAHFMPLAGKAKRKVKR